MIDYEIFCQIRLLHDQKHLKAAQIAKELRLDPKTVEKWIGRATYEPRHSPRRASKLDPFKGSVVAMLERHPYSAQQILQRLREQGYGGGYTILKEFVRQVRPVRKPAFLMLEFAPGEAAQVDWGNYGSIQVGSTRRRLSFFVMVLCHSRLMYVEFTLRESMEHFLTCHRNALEYFGGSTSKVILDNLKVGVLRHPAGQKAQFNPRYLDFAAHHGFEPVACNVGAGHEKGRVENGVGYVKKNFLNGLEITSFEAINPAARHWLDTVANVRLHGETRRKPREHFQQEQPHLKALPPMPYDCAVIHPTSANRCCRVRFDANRYSVPHLYASQKLSLKIYPDELYIYHHEKLIATHPRSYDRHQKVDNPDHARQLVVERRNARQQSLLLAFLNLTPLAERYCRKLQDKRLNTAHHIQKIVALSEVYGAAKVGQAIEIAIGFEAYGCEYVANILAQRERPASLPGALHLTRRQDLLELQLPSPDLSAYEPKPPPKDPNVL